MGRWGWLVGLCALPLSVIAGEPVTVAVASNFSHAARELATAFEAAHGHPVRLSLASSGKLYAQIVHGAPFDIFLSADAQRPKQLERDGRVVPGSRVTYATGRLVLWSVDRRYHGRDCPAELKAGNIDRLALANPAIAPYGEAAMQTLAAIGVDTEALASRMVMGESVAQTLQFVASGGVSMGFVAAAQLHQETVPSGTCAWFVPASLHAPIEQQAVLLRRAAGRPAATAFMTFLASDRARAIISSHGYGSD